MNTTPTVIGFGALIGLSLGLTGSGGSILAIPLLVYGVGLPLETALTMSLLIVASIALFGAIRQTFAGNVDWRAAFLFSITGIVISPLVIHFSYNINGTLRVISFAILMIFVSWQMAFPYNNWDSKNCIQHPQRAGMARIAVGGALAGVLSGFFGIGGGFIIVPQLTLLFAKSYLQAVGTSLASIVLISSSAIASILYKNIQLDWILMATFISGGLIGLLAGSALASRISDQHAKKTFALITTTFAIFILVDKLFLH